MEISYTTRTYKLVGITPMLGSNPANPDIHSEFVSSKAAQLERAKAENEMLPTAEELNLKIEDIKKQGLTVFLRDNGHLVIGNHVIKGFLKSALLTLKDQVGIAAAKSKVDNLVFIEPSFIPITRNGEMLTKADDYNERSLRADTMQGPRVGLVSSEEVQAPWELTVSITLLENKGSAKSNPVTWDMIETALLYGRYKGLGQWRNSGKGSFTFERIK
jgi:hypothetical protein